MIIYISGVNLMMIIPWIVELIWVKGLHVDKNALNVILTL